MNDENKEELEKKSQVESKVEEVNKEASQEVEQEKEAPVDSEKYYDDIDYQRKEEVKVGKYFYSNYFMFSCYYRDSFCS